MKKFIENFSNTNIRIMKLYKNMNVGSMNFMLNNTPVILQTIWSDLMHVTVFDKNYSDNKNKYDIDFKDFEETSYQVFQDNTMFPEYKTDDKCISVEHNELCKYEIRKENNDELLMISRIPQEFNLEIQTNRDIYIVNTGDSKLVSDKYFKVNNTGENIFECRRLRTNIFDFVAEKIYFSIKSSLETKVLKFICIEAIISIKKLGVVNNGIFDIKNGNLDIRAIYASQTDFIEMNVYQGMIKIGSLQGNMKINTINANIIIENLDCNSLIVNSSQNNEIEIFINNIKEESVINSNEDSPHKFFINKEANNSFTIIWKKDILYGTNDNRNVLMLNTKLKPDICEVEYWDYMKRKIQRVIDLKKKELI
jgi:hypothetical protein